MTPGPLVLFGSGETASGAQRVHATALARITPPHRACVLETPAGFEPNSARVAGRLAHFLRQRCNVETVVVPARKRGTPESPEESAVVAPVLAANYLMLGPGSPTYAVSQLAGSLAWHTVLARHRLGAALVLASAAAIAASSHALPVYEIYKVGEDLGWRSGLDVLGPFGWRVAVVPHWNNREGGGELDTSRCFMGRERFERLLAMLPSDVDVLGIDEHTALLVDFARRMALVYGRGGVTRLHPGGMLRVDAGASLALETLGITRRPDPADGLPEAVWSAACRTRDAGTANWTAGPPGLVRALVSERAVARARRLDNGR